MVRHVIAFILALVIGLPAGWTFAMALTPLLWRLEAPLHVELAGHSGPSDWIFYLVWAIVVPALFFLLRFVVLREPERTR